MNTRINTLTLVLACAASLTAGCSHVDAPVCLAAPTSMQGISTSSSLIVTGVAGPARTEKIDGIEFTLTTFRIKKAAKDQDPALHGRDIIVWQEKSASDGKNTGTTSSLKKGKQYLLYLIPSHDSEPSHPKRGHYAMTNLQSIWMNENGKYLQEKSPSLPQELTVTEKAGENSLTISAN